MRSFISLLTNVKCLCSVKCGIGLGSGVVWHGSIHQRAEAKIDNDMGVSHKTKRGHQKPP